MHSHVIGDVKDLQATLDDKAQLSHDHDTLYQLKYAKVAVVATQGGDYGTPTDAMNYLATWCGTPSEINPCLGKVMPGVYDLGATPLQLSEWVDIEGAGKTATRLVGAVPTDRLNPTSAVLIGASNCEVRMLTVENTGNTGMMSVAVLNNGASPSLSDVNAISGPDTWVVGIYNIDSSPRITGAAVEARVAYVDCVGIENVNSSPTVTATSVVTRGAGSGYYGAGVRVRGAASSPVLSGLAVNCEWSSGNGINTGVLVVDSNSLRLSDSTIIASGGTWSVALFAGIVNSTLLVDRSTLSAGYSILSSNSVAPSSIKIGASKLEGMRQLGSIAHFCAGVYDGNYSLIDGSCQ